MSGKRCDKCGALLITAERRSDAANRRYWGVIVPVVAETLSRGRVLPISKDQAHYALKCAFAGVEETPLGPVPKSTAAMSTVQFYEYTLAIEAHFRTEYGAHFPDEPPEAA